MASGWEVAAVVGPLVLAFIAMIVSGVVSASPAAIAFFQRWTRRILSYVFPSQCQCRVLLWKDIPRGLIHTCHSTCQHVNPQAIKPHEPSNCWEDSIGRVFNQLSSPRNGAFLSSSETIMKLSQLPLFQDYVLTDAQTLKAFLLLTVDSDYSCEIVDMKSLLDISIIDSVVTVHLKAASTAPTNPALTKFEVERMVEGYPPFYRSIILTPSPGNYQFESPIRENHDISKGAWILAVGLSINVGPVPSLYNMQQLHRKNNTDSEYWRGTLVMAAFDMIGRTLQQLISFEQSCRKLAGQYEVGSDDLWSYQAWTCYTMIMSRDYSLKPWVIKLNFSNRTPYSGRLSVNTFALGLV